MLGVGHMVPIYSLFGFEAKTNTHIIVPADYVNNTDNTYFYLKWFSAGIYF